MKFGSTIDIHQFLQALYTMTTLLDSATALVGAANGSALKSVNRSNLVGTAAPATTPAVGGATGAVGGACVMKLLLVDVIDG